MKGKIFGQLSHFQTADRSLAPAPATTRPPPGRSRPPPPPLRPRTRCWCRSRSTEPRCSPSLTWVTPCSLLTPTTVEAGPPSENTNARCAPRWVRNYNCFHADQSQDQMTSWCRQDNSQPNNSLLDICQQSRPTAPHPDPHEGTKTLQVRILQQGLRQQLLPLAAHQDPPGHQALQV